MTLTQRNGLTFSGSFPFRADHVPASAERLDHRASGRQRADEGSFIRAALRSALQCRLAGRRGEQAFRNKRESLREHSGAAMRTNRIALFAVAMIGTVRPGAATALVTSAEPAVRAVIAGGASRTPGTPRIRRRVRRGSAMIVIPRRRPPVRRGTAPRRPTLENGALPLGALREHVEAWITEKEAG
jgi:hypothetical protein